MMSLIFSLFIDRDKPQEVCATVHERTALIFVLGFIAIRLGIYVSVRIKAAKINSAIQRENR